MVDEAAAPAAGLFRHPGFRGAVARGAGASRPGAPPGGQPAVAAGRPRPCAQRSAGGGGRAPAGPALRAGRDGARRGLPRSPARARARSRGGGRLRADLPRGAARAAAARLHQPARLALPKYRGAAPIQAAVAAGETVDRGERAADDPRARRRAGAGLRRPADRARRHRRAAFPPARRAGRRGAGRGGRAARPRAGSGHAPGRRAGDLRAAARAQRRRHRLPAAGPHALRPLAGLQPWPGLYSQLGGAPLKILACRPLPEAYHREPGTVIGLLGEALAISCGGGTILGALRVQRPNRAAISAAEFWRGEHLEGGEKFSLPAA